MAENIRQLAEFLSQGLHKNGLSTLLPNTNLAKKSLESQFALNDALGIPYTVVLTLSTLNNGIAGLRSRETTLEVIFGNGVTKNIFHTIFICFF